MLIVRKHGGSLRGLSFSTAQKGIVFLSRGAIYSAVGHKARIILFKIFSSTQNEPTVAKKGLFVI
jgi:hypothetical protein